MWKVILILTLIFGKHDINLVYSSPQAYASHDACMEAMDGDDITLEAWLNAKTEEFLALPVLVDKRDLTFYCAEVDNNEQPI